MQGQDPRRGFRQGLTTVDDVRAHTKASASCGSCTGLVEKLLNHALGDAFAAGPAVKPMYSCTSYGHDDVRRLIVAKELRSIPEVMQELGWSSPDGCSKCRPALNYYLVCAWPGEYRDDPQSRLINERAHANIQKDGTYSVVPRMGRRHHRQGTAGHRGRGRTLRHSEREGDGRARIDLLGVKKEQLPLVWADLNRAGMISATPTASPCAP